MTDPSAGASPAIATEAAAVAAPADPADPAGLAIAAPQRDALGVVGAIRIPGAERAREWWSGLPKLAQVFVALAALDLVMRALGLFRTSLFVDLSYPLSIITAFLPHDALILLPAVLVLRRPDALVAAPLVMRGAMAVALSELLGQPLRGLLSGNFVDPYTLPTIVFIVGIVATAGGWLAIAEGLRPLTPPQVDINAAGLANLVAGAIGVGAVIQLVTTLVQPGPDLDGQLWPTLFRLVSAASALGGLAFAYLGRTVIRARGDTRRPRQALELATVAFVLFAIGSLLMILFTVVALALTGLSGIWSGVLTGLSLLTGPVATTAVVVAFGLGLADPTTPDPSGTIGGVTNDTQSALSA